MSADVLLSQNVCNLDAFPDEFKAIIENARKIKKPLRVAVAGADCENILRGVFEAEKDGFVEPVLIGNYGRIRDMLERLGLLDRHYDLQPITDDVNVVQFAIEMINAGRADCLMRGNTQTRDFLMPIVNKGNHLKRGGLMTHVNILKIPDLDKPIAISDVTMLVAPSIENRKDVIRNMCVALKVFGVADPKIALLSLVDKPSFHMRDTVEAQTIVNDHEEEPIADCTLVGPIPYDLIMSKEAARLKNYDCDYCGEFDGIVVPNLLTGNLLVKVLHMHTKAWSCGIIVGAKVPIAITSRSDSMEKSYLSLCVCANLAQMDKYRRAK